MLSRLLAKTQVGEQYGEDRRIVVATPGNDPRIEPRIEPWPEPDSEPGSGSSPEPPGAPPSGRFDTRWTTEPLPSLCTVDDVLAVIPVRHSREEAFTVLESSAAVRAFTAMYDAVWARAWQPQTGEPLPDELRAILDLAVSGSTDRAAQRALGLSARTHSRRMSELLSRLRARSRFQAGVEAARRGLV